MKLNGNRFRQKRFSTFLSVLDRTAIKDRPIRILDIGGTTRYWAALEPLWRDHALDITIVNLGVTPADTGNFHERPGDACDLDYADNSFDIVHSNSVIEHVGHWEAMCRMAGEVRRLAPHYYVQTPNFWFPLEPHYRTLFFQWYPEATRARMLTTRKRGFRKAATLDEAMRNIQTVNLLTAGQMRVLFPDARLERERVGPLTKSLIAVR